MAPDVAAAIIDHWLATQTGLNHDGQAFALAGAQLSLTRRVIANSGGGV